MFREICKKRSTLSLKNFSKQFKEAALLVLANVAAGGELSKQCIMGNEDVLGKIHSYMVRKDC